MNFNEGVIPTNHKNEDYLKLSVITGLLYDIVYTNTLFLNLTIFYIVVHKEIK